MHSKMGAQSIAWSHFNNNLPLVLNSICELIQQGCQSKILINQIFNIELQHVPIFQETKANQWHNTVYPTLIYFPVWPSCINSRCGGTFVLCLLLLPLLCTIFAFHMLNETLIELHIKIYDISKNIYIYIYIYIYFIIIVVTTIYWYS